MKTSFKINDGLISFIDEYGLRGSTVLEVINNKVDIGLLEQLVNEQQNDTELTQESISGLFVYLYYENILGNAVFPELTTFFKQRKSFLTDLLSFIKETHHPL